MAEQPREIVFEHRTGQVFALLKQGKHPNWIAGELGISVMSVTDYIGKMKRRLRLQPRASIQDVLRKADELGVKIKLESS